MINAPEQMAALARMWGEMASQMWQNAMNMQPTNSPPDFARQLRDSMFAAMSQSLDTFMRSPPAQEMVRQMLESAITWRKQWNEMLTEARHQTQGVAGQDIDNLMLAIRHLETRLLERLDEMDQRIGELANRPPASHESEANGNGNANGASAGTSGPARVRRRGARAVAAQARKED